MSILKVDELQSRTSGNRITLPDVNNYPPYRNLIINGDMSIAQRGTSVSSITSTGYRTCDRFQPVMNSSGTWTISQSTDTPTGQGFSNSFKFDCTTADASPNYLFLKHAMEGQMLQHLKKGTSNAESVTLSFWVKSNKTGTYQVNLRDEDNSRIIGNTYSISLANTWEKKTITFAGDTTGTLDNDNNTSLYLEWWLDSGSTYNTGSVPTSWEAVSNADRGAGLTVNLADSTANDWYITGVQLEVGDSATPFEHLPYDVNKERCMRYCVVYGKNEPSGGNFTAFPSVAKCVGSTTNIDFQLHHPVDLRTADVSVSASTVHISDIVSQGSDISGINVRSSNKGIRSTNFYSTASTACTVGNIFWVMTDNDASGYIIVDAEL